MRLKTTSKLFLVTLVLFPYFTFADLVITEVMYDLPVGSDSGREWIEVYNSGPATVDLTKLRLFENGTNHKITGNGALAPGAYAVIADNPAKFKTDWPQYAGPLFDSAFALGNAGDSFELRDASSTPLDSASFTSGNGAAGDGNTLNRSKAAERFSSHTPTPGTAMSMEMIRPKEKEVSEPKVTPVKKSSKAQKTAPSPQDIAPVVDTVSDSAPESQVAAAGTATTAPWQWWLAAGLLATASAGAIVFARRFAKDEWDIVEDTSE